ncbi:hypothetical protein D3C80_1720460 [compost metagenome]
MQAHQGIQADQQDLYLIGRDRGRVLEKIIAHARQQVDRPEDLAVAAAEGRQRIVAGEVGGEPRV